MCKERKQVFSVCYLVRARAMAQMACVNFVCYGNYMFAFQP